MPEPAPAASAPRRRRGRILISLLALLLLVGVVPLLGTSYNLVSQSREDLEFNQRATQLGMARGLAQQIATYVDSLHSLVVAIARTMEIETGNLPFSARVTRIGEQKDLERYLGENSHFNYVSVVDTN